MARARLGTVLHHIHRLAGSSGLDDLGDGDLLERFAARGEEAAFTVLVRRHGPMVLGVCRRLLPHGPDAEDAFQATFLVLFRRARSLDRAGSVANWLYTVAYHVALRARADAARRQQRERAAPPRDYPSAANGWSDLQPVLDEELTRLPDKYRAPVVLCYLEGKTNEEAGRLLGCPAGTVKGRLARARDLLRARLARRGITLSAGAAAALLAGRAAAAVPRALVAAAVRTAAGLPYPSAAALADGAMRAAVPGKGKLVASLLLVLGLIVGSAGILAAGARTLPPAEATTPMALPAPEEAPPDVKPAEEPKRDFTVAGKVLDADGEPVPGARVAVIGLAEPPYRGHVGFRDYETLGSGETDNEGRFRLDCAAETATPGRIRQVIASAAGHGLGWCYVLHSNDKNDVVVKLPDEQVIRGRLIDLQGQPAKGVALHVSEVTPASGGNPANRARDCPAYYDFAVAPKKLTPWPAAIKTDAEGRFVLRGMGKGMAVTLLVTDERFARQQLVVRNTEKGKPEAFEQSLEPPHILEGKVGGEDTHKPVGKVLLEIHRPVDPDTWRSEAVQVWTDEEGKFRVNCPLGRLIIYPYPANGSPYLSRMKMVEWPRGKVKHEVDVGLPRGVLVRGKVTEAESGKPVAGATVYYFKREDNPFTEYTITSWSHGPGEFVQTKADGCFEAAVYPGEGSLLVKGPTRDFVLQKLDTKLLSLGKPGGAPLYAGGFTALNLKAGADPREANLTLRRGVTVRGRVLDPDGKPVQRAVLYHATHLRDNGDWAYYFHYALEPVAVKDGQFELTGCDPKAKFPVCVLDCKNQTGGRAMFSVADAKEEPTTIRLQPCGRAALRYVGDDGKPQKGHGPDFGFDLDAEAHAALSVAEMLGPEFRLPYSDEEGRVTVTGLIPGVTYRYYDGKKWREFTVEAGKTRELPDIVYTRPPNPPGKPE
jgi:RNA polymerase sigma factor (sigma-70 family)